MIRTVLELSLRSVTTIPLPFISVSSKYVLRIRNPPMLVLWLFGWAVDGPLVRGADGSLVSHTATVDMNLRRTYYYGALEYIFQLGYIVFSSLFGVGLPVWS
jgi:hypothetical protein